jgi:ABC-type phosphate/phosphonate transport system substrate-binding protein
MNRRPAALLLVCALWAAPFAARADLVLSAAPRESAARSLETYQPIAEFLTKALGQPVVYRHPDNWIVYQSDMRKDVYDLALDGPHFIGWRMAALGHAPVVKFPGQLSFVVIARKDNDRVKTLKDLIGQSLCGFAPPNLATVVTLYEFDNPVRQPALVDVQGFRVAYEGVVSGKCTGGILQTKLYEEYDKEKQAVKIVFRSQPLPNQGISASKRISPELRAKITEALLSPAGKAATQKLREEFKNQDLVPAGVLEYDGLGVLLRDVWGFDLPAGPAAAR